MVPVICGRDTTELEARACGWRRWGSFANLPLNDLLADLQGLALIVGTSEEVIAQIHAYAAVGVEEVVVQWAGVRRY